MLLDDDDYLFLTETKCLVIFSFLKTVIFENGK